jgi:hypothetical protein
VHKAPAAADLIAEWTRGAVSTDTFDDELERMNWESWIGSGRPGELLAVWAGIDDFQSRLCLTQDLRGSAGTTQAELIHIQIGLGRDMGVVSTFSNRWQDACPVCYLPRWPGREPCLVFSEEGEPARGDLLREARVCADWAAQVIRGCLEDGIGPWVNQKTSFTFAGSDWRQNTRHRHRMPDCHGPHQPAVPIRWDKNQLQALEEAWHGW